MAALALAACALAAPWSARPAHADEAKPAAAPATLAIRSIKVEDNTKTTDDTVILVAGVEVGDPFKPDMIDRIRADLVGSGLFKNVQVTYGPTTGGIELIISAEDKHSWIVAPTYYNQPTNQGGGLGFGENNLFGENKKLLVYGQIATGDSFFIAGYIDPSIRGTRFKWQADLYLKRERSIEYASPDEFLSKPKELRLSKMNYLNAGVVVGINLFRGAAMDVRLRGAKVSFDSVTLAEGADLMEVTGDPSITELPAPGEEGWDVSTELRLDYDRRANWYGVSQGSRYRINLGKALPELSSDFDYWYANVRFEHAARYFSSHNLIVKLRAAYGRDLPFQQEFMAGGTAQRGYKNNQFRGDTLASANLEYSFQLFQIKGVALRLLGFYDSSYAAFLDTDETDVQRHYLPGHDELGLAPFKNTVGVGTRLYIRQIVLPLLGLDVGWGLERGDYEIYLAIGLTDL